jgi:hypothetical protein
MDGRPGTFPSFMFFAVLACSLGISNISGPAELALGRAFGNVRNGQDGQAD